MFVFRRSDWRVRLGSVSDEKPQAEQEVRIVQILRAETVPSEVQYSKTLPTMTAVVTTEAFINKMHSFSS